MDRCLSNYKDHIGAYGQHRFFFPEKLVDEKDLSTAHWEIAS
jgi:hypothetical protein